MLPGPGRQNGRKGPIPGKTRPRPGLSPPFHRGASAFVSGSLTPNLRLTTRPRRDALENTAQTGRRTRTAQTKEVSCPDDFCRA